MRVLSISDKLSLCWELLLRIDSLVFTGMINTSEACDLRKAVMGSKFSVTDVFFDVRQKTDSELLVELRHFTDGSRK